jgi:hypothetical protein
MPDSISVFDIVPPPNTVGQRLRILFKAHELLERSYGEAYRAVKGMLDAINEGESSETSADDPNVPRERAARNALKQAILDMRRRTVLDFKRSIALAEFAIDEIAPGTFNRDDPLQSDDRDKDDLKEAFNALGAFSAAVAGAAALIPGGQGVAAFAAGYTVGIYGGVAALEMMDML